MSSLEVERLHQMMLLLVELYEFFLDESPIGSMYGIFAYIYHILPLKNNQM